MSVHIKTREIFRRRRDGQQVAANMQSNSAYQTTNPALYETIATISSWFELVNPGETNEYLRVKKPLGGDYGIRAYVNSGQFAQTIWDSMPVASENILGGVKVGSTLSIVNGVLNLAEGTGFDESKAYNPTGAWNFTLMPTVGGSALALASSVSALEAIMSTDTERLAAITQLASAYQEADTDLNNTLTTALTTKLNASSYTPADVLSKLLTVDGIGSGLDAEFLGGQQAGYYAPLTYVDGLGATKVSKTGDTMTGKLILSGHGSQKLMMSYSSIGFSPVADSITGNLVLGQWEDYFLDLTNGATDTAADATVFRINANTATGKEATLALVRGEYPNIEFLDFYNNGYTDSNNYGIRIQKRGTGEYRDFKIDQSDGTTRTPLLMIKTNGYVGVGTNDPDCRLHVNGNGHYNGSLFASSDVISNTSFKLRDSAGTLKWTFTLSGDDLVINNASGTKVGTLTQAGSISVVGGMRAYTTY